jgi:hypothetical protein
MFQISLTLGAEGHSDSLHVLLLFHRKLLPTRLRYAP